jgi:succinylglutamate desuccinylase
MKKQEKILFVTATHGDEPIGVEVVREIKKTKLGGKFSSIIGNPKALKKKARFVDADLNRIFPGNSRGNYEERRACQIIKKMNNFDCVIDLHGTVSSTGIFIIMTRLNLKNLELALRFDISKIVVWPEASETSGSLSTFAKRGMGIEIESGEKSDPKIKKKLKKILSDFLKNKKTTVNIEKEIKSRKFFSVIGKINKKEKNEIKVRDWKKIEGFLPVFVNQYPNILCYKLKKIESAEVLAKAVK